MYFDFLRLVSNTTIGITSVGHSSQTKVSMFYHVVMEKVLCGETLAETNFLKFNLGMDWACISYSNVSANYYNYTIDLSLAFSIHIGIGSLT